MQLAVAIEAFALARRRLKENRFAAGKCGQARPACAAERLAPSPAGPVEARSGKPDQPYHAPVGKPQGAPVDRVFNSAGGNCRQMTRGRTGLGRTG